MNPTEAIKIIQSLIDGTDPHTGEAFPHNSPYQHPQVLRALFLALRSLEHIEKRQRRNKTLPKNAGKPWHDEEETMLCEEFDAGLSIAQLARKHQRTESAIRSRLEKLGKIPPAFNSAHPS